MRSSCTVWAGDSSVSVATPTVIWGNNGTVSTTAGAAITMWCITFAAADTASLTPGIYRIQVFGTHGSRTATLFDGILEIVSTAGSNSPSDLVSYTTVETLLARLRLRESEREMLPFLITQCSDAIRKWCGQRRLRPSDLRPGMSTLFAPKKVIATGCNSKLLQCKPAEEAKQLSLQDLALGKFTLFCPKNPYCRSPILFI